MIEPRVVILELTPQEERALHQVARLRTKVCDKKEVQIAFNVLARAIGPLKPKNQELKL